MKIAVIVPAVIPSGPIMVARNLAEGLINLGHTVDLFYIKETQDNLPLSLQTRNIKNISLDELETYDIIHSHCFSADRYCSRLINKLKRPKFISTIHQNTFQALSFHLPKPIAYIITKFWSNKLNNFDAIATISKDVKTNHLRFFRNKERMHVIHNGLTFEKISTSHPDENLKQIVNKISEIKKENKGNIILCSYARLAKSKGYDQLFPLLEKDKRFHLILIGNGEYKKILKDKTKKSGISDNVHFFDAVVNPFHIISYIDVFMMPSYSEGFGLSLIEAAYNRAAIVCSDIPSFRELFDEDEVSFFELNNYNDLKIKLLHTLENKKKLSDKAFHKASIYSDKEMIKNYENLYLQLLSH